jgi:hypothetical protein
MRKAAGISGVDFVESRNKLYYNRYTYKVRIELYGVGILWDTPDVSSFRRKLGVNNSLKINNRLQQGQSNLEKFIEWKFDENRKNKCLVRIERNTACVFSNDLDYLKEVGKLFDDCNQTFVIADVLHSADVMYFKREPKNNFRVYLQYTKITADEGKSFIRFIKSKPEFKPSYALSRWMDRQKHGSIYWVHSSLFVDLDDEKEIFFMRLKYGNIIGKHFKLEQRPEVE